jgi:hypothetical protein
VSRLNRRTIPKIQLALAAAAPRLPLTRSRCRREGRAGRWPQETSAKFAKLSKGVTYTFIVVIVNQFGLGAPATVSG